MGLDLIRRMVITYLSVEDMFIFESCFQKAINFTKRVRNDSRISARSSKNGTMGLLGFSASFQRLVQLAMAGVVNIMVYIDELLVHSKNKEDHLIQFKNLVSRLRNVGPKSKVAKM
jgi:hypothetical protein